jgi:hypothetical protein
MKALWRLYYGPIKGLLRLCTFSYSAKHAKIIHRELATQTSICVNLTNISGDTLCIYIKRNGPVTRRILYTWHKHTAESNRELWTIFAELEFHMECFLSFSPHFCIFIFSIHFTFHTAELKFALNNLGEVLDAQEVDDIIRGPIPQASIKALSRLYQGSIKALLRLC